MSGESKLTLPLVDWTAVGLGLLVSFPYLEIYEQLLEKHPHIAPVSLMLDSGAFTAYQTGMVIDLDKLTAESLKPRWNETVALDVVGDADKTWRNAVYMRNAGANAYPVFHIGESWDWLKMYCESFEKVGLSCRFGETKTESQHWLEQCFARQWPHKFHSFGYVANSMLTSLPFHSADTASWNNRPSRWGLWKAYSGKALSVRGVKDLRAEVDAYANLQGELRQRWARELEPLDSLRSISGSKATRRSKRPSLTA